MMNEHDQKLKDLELTQGNAETMDDFNEIFADLSLDREFWTDPQRCKVAKHLMFRQGKFLGKAYGRERFQAMKGQGAGDN